MGLNDVVTTDPLRRATGLTLAEFAAAHWGTTALLRRAAELPGAGLPGAGLPGAGRPGAGRPGAGRPDAGFADLLSLADVDELLSRRGLRTPFIRMAKDGDVIAPRRFTRGGGAGADITDQVADDKVLVEFAGGATLVLQALHRVWPPVIEFATSLAAQLGHPVQVNAYLTPPQNTGFSAHYDVHDVFVLQFAGRKNWRIHEPVLPAPLRDQPWEQRRSAVAARAAEPPLLETVLEPGDTLYLPRGFLHSASALGEVSGHLTVGVHPVTRQALAAELLATLKDDVELRRSLPVGVDLADPDVIAGELEATVAALHSALDRLDPAIVAPAVGRLLAGATRPQPLAPLAQLAAAAALTGASRVQLRPGLRLTVRPAGDELVLQLPDKQVRVPASVGQALRVATSGAGVTVGALPGLSPDDAVTLVRRLLREGVLVPA